MTLMDLGQRVLLQRRALSLSQEELAQRCGFRYQVLSRLERGHQDIYAMRLARIAQELGVSADYLLGICEDPEPCRTSRHPPTARASAAPAAEDQASTIAAAPPLEEEPTPAAAPPGRSSRKPAKPPRATARRRTADERRRV